MFLSSKLVELHVLCTVDGTIHPVLGALGFGRIAFFKAVLGGLAH